MRIPTRARQHGFHFNITPLIDVVFLLIIFFLVASYLSQTENAEEIELAAADTGSTVQNDTPRRMVLTVTSDEKYLLAGKEISAVDFELLLTNEKAQGGLEEFEVRIRADRRVPYRVIEPLLMACAQAGVRRIKWNVLPGG